MRIREIRKNIANHRPLLVWLFAWAYAVIVLLLVSWDSYLYDSWQHYDVHWFFACGKAWMEGLTPYVDFADSKGPLLWLIYGLGYRLSAYNYVGVYWLSTVAYGVTFYFAYRSARYAGCRQAVAALSVSLLSALMLSGLIHDEVRAEDFCVAFSAPAMAEVVRYQMLGEWRRRAFWLVGFAVGASLLIKYNVAVMLCGLALSMCLSLSARRRYGILKTLLMTLCGFLLVTLPFVIVFALRGNLDDFVREYFVNTLATLGNMRDDSLSAGTLIAKLTSVKVVVFLSVVVLCALASLRKSVHCRKLLLWLALWFAVVAFLNGKSAFAYFPLSLIALAGLPHLLSSPRWHGRAWLTLAVALLLLALTFKTHPHQALFTHGGDNRRCNVYYQGLIAQKPLGTIMYLHCFERGYGVAGRALPACKYWSLQMGFTPEMLLNQHETIAARKADFVVVRSTDSAGIALLERYGYQRYDYVTLGLPAYDRNLIYSKHRLDPKRADVAVSDRDILLKRRIF